MTSRGLVLFGSRQILEKVSGSVLMLQLDSDIFKPVDVVRDLGVLLDTELSLRQHITRIASNCFYHLRRLQQIRRVVGEDVTSQLISAFVLSRLDYCNSLLAGLPRTSVEPLQRVQSAAGRLVLNLGSSWSRDTSTEAASYTGYLSNIESNTSCVQWCIKSTLGVHHSSWLTLCS